MREIKFRAWDKEQKIMIEFDEFYVDAENSSLSFSASKYPGHGSLPNLTPMDNPEGRYEIMQFTGLLDKNGKEIYEGDIVLSIDGHVFSIEYKIISNCGDCFDESGIGFDFKLFMSEHCEVIGNIYENPKLLEERNE